MSKAVSYGEILRQVSLFEDLDEQALQALSEVANEREYNKGAVIFFEHDRGDALYIVLSGAIKIYRVGEDGREKTLTLLDRGAAFGEMALLDGQARSAVAEALERSHLLIIHRTDFNRLIGERPALALAVIQVLSQRLRRANAQLMDLVFRDVRSRLVKVLLEVAEQHGVDVEGGRRIELKLTHQELANLVGTSRESVTRTLTDLQDQNLLGFMGRNLVLYNLGHLGRLAE